MLICQKCHHIIEGKKIVYEKFGNDRYWYCLNQKKAVVLAIYEAFHLDTSIIPCEFKDG
jgi:hypothetical protein